MTRDTFFDGKCLHLASRSDDPIEQFTPDIADVDPIEFTPVQPILERGRKRRNVRTSRIPRMSHVARS